MKKTLIVGTVAYDEIETSKGSSGKILGGAGTYIALACSHFKIKDVNFVLLSHELVPCHLLCQNLLVHIIHLSFYFLFYSLVE